jgi:hypothetical protein
LGAALLVFSPRIFAEAFHNYKDLVFMNLFAVGAYTLTRLLRRPTAKRAAVHALVTALATDVRIMGLLLPVLTVGLSTLELWVRPPRRAAFLRTMGLYAVMTGPLVVLFWPYLWEAPVQRLWLCFRSFARYRQALKGLYWGRLVSAQHLPWHYLPGWLLVTTGLFRPVWGGHWQDAPSYFSAASGGTAPGGPPPRPALYGVVPRPAGVDCGGKIGGVRRLAARLLHLSSLCAAGGAGPAGWSAGVAGGGTSISGPAGGLGGRSSPGLKRGAHSHSPSC